MRGAQLDEGQSRGLTEFLNARPQFSAGAKPEPLSEELSQFIRVEAAEQTSKLGYAERARVLFSFQRRPNSCKKLHDRIDLVSPRRVWRPPTPI